MCELVLPVVSPPGTSFEGFEAGAACVVRGPSFWHTALAWPISPQPTTRIAVLGPDGTVLARGLSEYDAAECAALMGHPSAEHEALLGYAPRSALVHRDQLVML